MTATWTVGSITVHRIDELLLAPQTGQWLLPDATPDLVARQDWLRPDFAGPDAGLRLHSHSFAIEIEGLRVLVDTGIGNGKNRANPAWHHLGTSYLENLRAVGFTPDTVDLVVLTHLHTDHVGWNTHEVDGDWVPTFGNARHVTSRVERDFWAGYAMDAPRRQMFEDSVIPVEAAGLLEPVEVPGDGLEIVPGLRLLPTPGHTPGHLSVQLRSEGRTALISGDAVHHPVQLAHPWLSSCVDIDAAQAETTRRRLLASLAGTGTLLLGSHFPAPTGGHVLPEGGAYRLGRLTSGSDRE